MVGYNSNKVVKLFVSAADYLHYTNAVFLKVCPPLYHFIWFTLSKYHQKLLKGYQLLKGWEARCNATYSNKRRRMEGLCLILHALELCLLSKAFYHCLLCCIPGLASRWQVPKGPASAPTGGTHTLVEKHCPNATPFVCLALLSTVLQCASILQHLHSLAPITAQSQTCLLRSKIHWCQWDVHPSKYV